MGLRKWMSAAALVSLPIMFVVVCCLLCWRRYSKGRPNKTRPYDNIRPLAEPPPPLAYDDPPRAVAAPPPAPATRSLPPVAPTREIVLNEDDIPPPIRKPSPEKVEMQRAAAPPQADHPNGSAQEQESAREQTPPSAPPTPEPPAQTPVAATRVERGRREADEEVMEAISRGDVMRLQRALATAELGVNDVVDVDTGFTSLHTAAAYGRDELVFFLIEEAGADPLARDAEGRRPAEIAEKCGHARLAANIESYTAQALSPEQRAPLHGPSGGALSPEQRAPLHGPSGGVPTAGERERASRPQDYDAEIQRVQLELEENGRELRRVQQREAREREQEAVWYQDEARGVERVQLGGGLGEGGRASSASPQGTVQLLHREALAPPHPRTPPPPAAPHRDDRPQSSPRVYASLHLAGPAGAPTHPARAMPGVSHLRETPDLDSPFASPRNRPPSGQGPGSGGQRLSARGEESRRRRQEWREREEMEDRERAEREARALYPPPPPSRQQQQPQQPQQQPQQQQQQPRWQSVLTAPPS